MNLFCSRDPDDEFLEAMNTLERLKSKQGEKDNKNKNLSKESKIIKEISKKNNNEKLENINHKKNSTLLEIIEYPYKENNSNHKSKINSNITNFNCETQLLMEYSNKYKKNFDTKKLSNKNENKIKYVNNDVKIFNENVEKNINDFDKENNSSNSIIINNDYNISIISNIYELNINEKNHENNFLLLSLLILSSLKDEIIRAPISIFEKLNIFLK